MNKYYDYRDDLLKLYKESRRGNAQSEKGFRELYRKIATEANKRMASLERAGRDYFAYDRAASVAQKSSGKNRFRVVKSQSIDEVYQYAMSAAKFLTQKTSLVSGHREIEKSRYEALKKNPNIDLSGLSRRKLSAFMQTELFREYVKFDSEAAFNLAEEALYKKKATLEDLEEAWEDFERGETDIFGVWENWAGIDPFGS